MASVCVCVQAANAAAGCCRHTFSHRWLQQVEVRPKQISPVSIIQIHYGETIVQPLCSDTQELPDERQNAYLISLFTPEWCFLSPEFSGAILLEEFLTRKCAGCFSLQGGNFLAYKLLWWEMICWGLWRRLATSPNWWAKKPITQSGLILLHFTPRKLFHVQIFSIFLFAG